MTLKSLKGIRHQANFGSLQLAIGDRIHVRTRFKTTGEGTITGFRDNQGTTFIRVKLDAGTEFHPYDRWELKKGFYDRLQDIGVPFNEIKVLATGLKPKNDRRKKVVLADPEVVQESSNDSLKSTVVKKPKAVKVPKPAKSVAKKVTVKATKKTKPGSKVSEPA